MARFVPRTPMRCKGQRHAGTDGIYNPPEARQGSGGSRRRAITVVRQTDGTYGPPASLISFWTRAEAEAWIIKLKMLATLPQTGRLWPFSSDDTTRHRP